MPTLAPFRGLHYAADRIGPDLTPVVCPPYDVIGPDEQRVLLARHERNAVRLELNPEPDPHRAAAEALAAWRAEGTLVEAAEASVYRYAYGKPAAPDEPAVRALVARVQLEPWGDGVRPHEHTMPGPKADRLALLRATRTQLSPILALRFGGPSLDDVMGAPWTDAFHARDADDLRHWLAPARLDSRRLDELAQHPVFIADGHHRYETALAYQAEVRSTSPGADARPGSLAADWIMMVIVDADAEPLEIRPTHRLILDADPAALRALADANGAFSTRGVPPADLPGVLLERATANTPAFGLVLPGGASFLLIGEPGAVAERMRREPGSEALRGLDLSVLHAAILGDRLGIGAEEVAAGERLAYTRSASDAVDRVRRGEAAAALLVRPTQLDQLAAVASAGEVMPQKSTYFYPKLLTGMVFNPLED
jgi:uncharacterized protein (DUF1015 family)